MLKGLPAATRIWRWAESPKRETLTGLDGRIGIDLLARFTSEECTAIQCKGWERVGVNLKF